MNIVRYIISLTDEEISKSKAFAESSVNISLDKYKERGQKDIKNITRQIRQGKLAEYAVSAFLNETMQIPCSKPDIKIYDKKYKRFDVDLSCELGPINVKTCQSNDLYPVSWLFQSEDTLIKNCSPIEIVALTEIDRDELAVTIHGITRLKPLIPFLKKPLKKSLQNNKTVLYSKDIKEGEKLWLEQFKTH